MDDDSDLLRYDQADSDDAATRAEASPVTGAPAVAARTKTLTTYPTAANRFYAMETLIITGTESEGGAGTETGAADPTWYAYNLGSSVPPSGTKVLCRHVDWRWVFRYDG